MPSCPSAEHLPSLCVGPGGTAGGGWEGITGSGQERGDQFRGNRLDSHQEKQTPTRGQHRATDTSSQNPKGSTDLHTQGSHRSFMTAGDRAVCAGGEPGVRARVKSGGAPLPVKPVLLRNGVRASLALHLTAVTFEPLALLGTRSRSPE